MFLEAFLELRREGRVSPDHLPDRGVAPEFGGAFGAAKRRPSGVASLFTAMAAAGVKRMVFSSSATVYGDPASVPIREDFPLSATNPYGRTKLMIEQILRDLHVADPDWRIYTPSEERPPVKVGRGAEITRSLVANGATVDILQSDGSPLCSFDAGGGGSGATSLQAVITNSPSATAACRVIVMTWSPLVVNTANAFITEL